MLSQKDKDRLEVAKIIFSIKKSFTFNDIKEKIKHLDITESELQEILDLLVKDHIIIYGLFYKYRNI